MIRKVLIYGGYGAIGSAIGHILVERGYELHLVGRDEEKLAASAEELKAGYR